MTPPTSTGRKLSPIDRHVGQRVKLARAMVGMTQEKLAEAIGITFQQVQKYEKGVNRVGAGRLQHIAGVLGTSIDFFFDGAPSTVADSGPDSASSIVAAFMGLNESADMMRAFIQIEDASMRRLLVELIGKIGRTGSAS